MTTALRKTGISLVGDIPWGTHFCHFFKSKEDLLDILIPYIKAGLENNECVFWAVVDPLGEEEAKNALKQTVPEADYYLENGCIEIVPQTAWYLKDGTFMPEQVIDRWNSKLAKALAEGYDGLRVNGNFWLTKEYWTEFTHFEKTLDDTLANLPIIVLCSYPLTNTSAVQILDVVHTHQFALIRRDREWEIVESPDLKQAKAEIQRLNEELEQRVVERTQQLVALNDTLRREMAERQQIMEALRESEERFAKIFHSNPATQVIVRLSDRSFLDVNDAFCQTFGYTRAEVIGRTTHELGVWVSPQEPIDLMRRLREERVIYSYETLARTKSGGILDMLVSMELMEVAGELCVLATSYDISERKRMEEALRQSESNFRTLAEKSLQGIAIFQDQKMVYVNPALSAIQGYTVDELKSMSEEQLMALTHPLDRGVSAERIRKRMAGEELSPSVEFRILRKDGSTIWIQAFNSLIEYYGRPALLNTSIDITERKQAEEALRESEEKFSAAFRASPVAMIIATMDGKYVEVNQAFCDLLGYTREELLGKTAIELGIFTAETRQTWVEALARGGGMITNVELAFRARNGATRITLSSVETITLHDVPHRLSTSLDITGRKRAEEEIRQHAARMEALAGISQVMAETSLDHEAVLKAVARRTAEVIGDSCVITLFLDDGQRAFAVAFDHTDPKALAIMQEALLHSWQGGMDTERFRLLMAGESIYIPNVNYKEYRAVSEPEFWPYIDIIGVSSVLIVPLRVQGQVIGTLGITRDRTSSPYTPHDRTLLQELADRAGLTIANVQLFDQVRSGHERLQVLSRRLLEVQEAERRIIARELHDEIGQTLTHLKLLLDTSARLPLETTKSRLQNAQGLLNQLMDQVEELSLNLRPQMLDELGLLPTLLAHFERYTHQTGIQVTFKQSGLEGRHFRSELETTTYRLIQEALTNVARHAGVQEVTVRVWIGQETLGVEIEDQGVGFDPLATGTSMGLAGMRERVALLGGQLTIESAPGSGTQIMVELPLESSPERSAVHGYHPAGG